MMCYDAGRQNGKLPQQEDDVFQHHITSSIWNVVAKDFSQTPTKHRVLSCTVPVSEKNSTVYFEAGNFREFLEGSQISLSLKCGCDQEQWQTQGIYTIFW